MATMIKYSESYFRYQLDKSKPRKKYTCPSCGRPKCFTPIVDIETGQRIGDDFGVCDHIKRCGYRKFPKGKDLKDKELFTTQEKVLKPFLKNDGIINLIPNEYVMETMGDYRKNNLFKFLSTIYDEGDVFDVFTRYRVGTMDLYDWKGAAVFWQTDDEFRVRAGKIMDYDPKTGHRIKEPYSRVAWYHSLLGNDYSLRQCLFGLHLVTENVKGVCLVESEKTALICSLSDKKHVYVATGGLQNLREEVMDALIGKRIYVYPDKGQAEQRWTGIFAERLSYLDYVIRKKWDKDNLCEEGEDLADLILKKRCNTEVTD